MPMQNRKIFSILLISLQVFSSELLSRDLPVLKSRVTDETSTLSLSFRTNLEAKLESYEKETSNQIAVLIIESLNGIPIEEYSLEVAEKNKLGQKGKDNGVLLTIAKADKKLRIEVGYGLEGVLTDVLCKRIISNEITPSFKSGNFEEGIAKGIDAIMGGIGGTYTAPIPKDYSYLGPLSFFGSMDGGQNLPWSMRLFASLFVFSILSIFSYVALFTPYIGWFIYFFLFPFWSIFPIAFNGVDIGVSIFLIYVFGIGLTKLFLLVTPSGRKMMDSRSGGFISSSGGSRGGWSSSSGGFSGGGGSFGGGGSSGSW